MTDWLVEQRLIRAIQEKRLVRFTYKRGGTRIAEPHDFGVQHGIERLLAYQVSGFSETRTPPGWRMFDAGDLHDLVVLDDTFPGSRDDHQAHCDWDQLFARVV